MADDTSIPHFFLPLIPGFLTNFRIPKAFLKHLKLTESNNGNEFVAVLKARNGDTDKAWSVKVDTDGRRFMYGWKEFAQDHSLRVGDFLIFRYCGGFMFDVLVLDPVTACDRSFAVDPLIQSESQHSDTSECITETKSVLNSPSKGNALIFDPLVQSKSVQSVTYERMTEETDDQHRRESDLVPSPSKDNVLVFDPVTKDPLNQSESVRSESNEKCMTESDQVPSPSKSNALASDSLTADPMIHSESVHSETNANEQHIAESEPVPSPSKGDPVAFDPVSVDPLIQSKFVQSETNEQHFTECEQVPSQASPSKGVDPLIQTESVHLETNEHNAEERVEFKPSGRPYIREPVKQSSLSRWHGHIIPTNFARENNLAKRWCDMTIIDQKDRSWHVHLRHRRTGKDQAYLCGGWNRVRDANGLKLGDTLVLEVIDSGDHPIMKFYKLS